MKYKLIKKYPSLPNDWEVGMVVGTGDRYIKTFSPFDCKYKDYYVPYAEVVYNPEYWEDMSLSTNTSHVVDLKCNEYLTKENPTFEKRMQDLEYMVGKIIEKGQKPEKFNENKLPDFKFTPSPPPPPKKENNSGKIVFDYFVAKHGEIYNPTLIPSDFEKVVEIIKIGENKYLFGAKDKSWNYPLIYIGHYE